VKRPAGPLHALSVVVTPNYWRQVRGAAGAGITKGFPRPRRRKGMVMVSEAGQPIPSYWKTIAAKFAHMVATRDMPGGSEKDIEAGAARLLAHAIEMERPRV
jgi:hypothetical protein